MAVRRSIAALEDTLRTRDIAAVGCLLVLWPALAVATSLPAEAFLLAGGVSVLAYLLARSSASDARVTSRR